MFVVLAALAVHPERGHLCFESEGDRNESVRIRVLAVVAEHDNARIAHGNLRPCALSQGVDVEKTVASVPGEDREEVQEEGRHRGVRRGSRGGPVVLVMEVMNAQTEGRTRLDNAEEKQITYAAGTTANSIGSTALSGNIQVVGTIMFPSKSLSFTAWSSIK